MKLRCATLAAGFILAALPALAQGVAPSIAALERTFLNPPDDAKPMVRWWWFGPAVTHPELLRELQQMKADGIGGAELAFVYPEALDDPAKGINNLSFLSADMLEAVRYAQTEGRKLGLRIDITLCSGWPYGGPHIALADAAAKLKLAEVAVPPNAKTIRLPTLVMGDTLISVSIANGTTKHWTAAEAQPLPLQMPADSPTLVLSPSAQERVALFFIASHTRQQVKRAAVGAEGFVLDPFSRQAVATHLAKVGEPLLSAFKGNPPYAIFSDSLEAYGADWTPGLPEEFKKRRGYDLLPHLPELVAGGTPAAENVRHDYGRTLTELVDENYLTQINDWAHAHGTKFRSQTYGEPAVSFASQARVDLIEGEGPQWRTFSTLRWASSAAHAYAHPVASGETFTWLHSPVFRATPLDMKAEADIDFIMGENSLSFHGWPYSPPASELQQGDPGWSLYAAGVFSDHNPWHPVMPAVTAYITRLSWLLRQGEPANQVAVLLPTDDAWASFAPGKVSVSAAMQTLLPKELLGAILSAGYNYDYIDAETIRSVGFGAHSIIVVPPTDRLPLETAQALQAFVAHGGKVLTVGKRPVHTPSGASEPAFSSMENIFGNGNGIPVHADAIVSALHGAAKPDLAITSEDPDAINQIGFIRRKLTGADVYFVTNTSNRDISARVQFGTPYERGVELDADTGKPLGGPTYSTQQMALAPYASRVFVFYEKGHASEVTGNANFTQTLDLSRDWRVSFEGIPKIVSEPTLRDWIADPSTLHYSGVAVYTRDFTLAGVPRRSTYLEVSGGTALPGAPNTTPVAEVLKNGVPDPLITRTGPGMHAYFDPPIHEAAIVFINGEAAGALWHPPYRLDVTKLLKVGKNQMEIRVYNTALNAWSALPPRDYGPLKAKYGDRFQMQDLDKVMPISSGLLGSIHLITQEPQ